MSKSDKNKSKIAIFIFLLISGLTSITLLAEQQNGLLIFLDDSINEIAITNDLLTAISQNSGPIVASASLMANISEIKKLDDKSPQKLISLYATLRPQINVPEKLTLLKDLIADVIDWQTLSKNWIIKEISPLLYLLIPDEYLTKQNLTAADVTAITTGATTSTELRLGLKVNHLRTVINLTEIHRPATEPQFASYFTEALLAENQSKIFVLKNEYQGEYANSIPIWSIYLTGHGMMNYAIADLSLEQFKNFLTFLAEKIKTKLLYYQSCYAAGLNNEQIYADEQTGIHKTYPYAIITGALTDATITAQLLELKIEQNILKIKSHISYKDFLNQSTTLETINYHDLATTLTPDLNDIGLNSAPQIKFPGLAWFSVLDNTKVVNIGSILAKTRTETLNIAKFFAKNGQDAKPLGILLYAQDLPFELTINTGLIANRPSDVISMIPGDALHNISKISSKKYNTEELLNSFLQINDLMPQKIFIINNLTGLNSSTMNSVTAKTSDASRRILTLQKIVIHLTKTKNMIYFTHNNMIYKTTGKLSTTNQAQPAKPEEITEYNDILTKYSTIVINTNSPDASTSIEVTLEDAQDQANTLFAQLIPTNDLILQGISDTLTAMPNNTILRFAELKGPECPVEQEDCWMIFFEKLSTSPASPDTNKIVWFDQISKCTNTEHCTIHYLDFITHAYQGYTSLYFKDAADNSLFNFKNGEFDGYQTDYKPQYEKIFKDYTTKNKLDTRSVQQMLTPEAIAKIRAAQEAKITAAKAAEATIALDIQVAKDLAKVETDISKEVAAL